MVLSASVKTDAWIIAEPEGFRVFWRRPIYRIAINI